MAGARAALERALERRMREVSASIEVGQAVAEAPEPEELFRRVVRLIQERFEYYHVRIYCMDSENQELALAEATGDAGAVLKERGDVVAVDQGVIGTAAATGEPVLIPDLQDTPGWVPEPMLPDARCELAVPITVETEVFFVIPRAVAILFSMGWEKDRVPFVALKGKVTDLVVNLYVILSS